ncbi:MAG: SLC13 family permease [Planctomycetaceae bacterium]
MLRPIWSQKHTGKYITGLVLVVSAGANLGGMASLIGTSECDRSRQPGTTARSHPSLVSEVDGPRTATGLLLLGILVLYVKKFYLKDPISIDNLLEQMTVSTDAESESETNFPPVARWQLWTVSGTCILTVLLWMTGQWHGLPTAVVSFLPIVIFTTSGVLNAKDVRSLQYDVLFLLAGGLALGQTITMTGLSTWLVDHIPTDSISQFWLVLVLGYATVLFSNFMSHTAGANILIPLGITLNPGMELETAVVIALCAPPPCACPSRRHQTPWFMPPRNAVPATSSSWA